MITFWIAAFIATAAAAALVVLYARRPVAIVADPAQAVYLRQLDEIEDLANRGLIEDEERRSAKAEAARRLLGEKTAAPETPVAATAPRNVALAIVATAAVALGLYLTVGKPNMPDRPFEQRLAEWKSQDPTSLAPEQLLAVLKSFVATKPNDPEGLLFLARLQTQLGDDFSAERNLEKAADINPNSSETWDLLGQLRVQIANNKVTPEALDALTKALALNPKLIAPRYLVGRTQIEQGHRAEGLALWRSMLPDLPVEGDGRETLNAQIASVEAGGGVVPAGADTAAAPPPSDPAIRAMVDGLAERLKVNPNDTAGWARLIRSYTVLQDEKAKAAALERARLYFKDRPKDLAAIEAAANVPQ